MYSKYVSILISVSNLNFLFQIFFIMYCITRLCCHLKKHTHNEREGDNLRNKFMQMASNILLRLMFFHCELTDALP